MKSRRRGVLLLIAVALLSLAACEKAGDDPTPTPNLAPNQTVAAVFGAGGSGQSASDAGAASPTPPPSTPRPAVAAAQGPALPDKDTVEMEVNFLVTQMQLAVRTGNYDGYMALVWDGDPLFYAEQAGWAQDWVDNPLSKYELRLFNVQVTGPDVATARMEVEWGQMDLSLAGSAGGTTITVEFRLEDGEWLFAGESWSMLENSGIRLYYFTNEIVNNESQARAVEKYLPEVYTLVTEAFDLAPDDTVHIKIYHTYDALQTMTRMSIPYLYRWNEPGEAIKIILGPQTTPPDDLDIARELAQYLLYQMGDGTHGAFPWWLEQGITEYAASLFRNDSQRRRITQPIALRLDSDVPEEQLTPWNDMTERTGFRWVDIQPDVYQAYTMVAYISQTYGAEVRNAWIRAIAAGQPVDEATDAHLGVTFDALDAGWQAWLRTQA